MTDNDLYAIADAGQGIANIVHSIHFIGVLFALAGWVCGAKMKRMKSSPQIWPDGFSPRGRFSAKHKTREEKGMT